MAKNEGKIFEDDFKESVPSYCYVHRLRDSAQSYNNSEKTKFAWDNECDFFIWDSDVHLFYAIECKSTKYKSMSVQLDKNDKSSKMIKFHQIESLKKISKYDGAIAGFILNFRTDEIGIQRTYFISVQAFLDMLEKINKKSFNELDLITVGNAIKIKGEKKRVHWKWDLDSFLQSQSQLNNLSE